MDLLARLRRSQVPFARVLVTLFASAWLGLAVQPCVAMDHFGAAGEEEHAGHGMPSGHGDHDCPHCPATPDDDDGCTDAAGPSCDGAGVPTLPSKDAKTPKADLVVLIGYLATHDPILLFSSVSPGSADAAPWRPPTSTIQQRYCTYLK